MLHGGGELKSTLNAVAAEIPAMDKSITDAVHDFVQETGGISNPITAKRNAHYKYLLSLGEDAVPMLLQYLRNYGSMFIIMLLQDITGVTAHDPEYNGYYKEMRKAWLLWGEMDFIWPDEEEEYV